MREKFRLFMNAQHYSYWIVLVLLVFGIFMLCAPARAACTIGACVSAGPRLASIDSTRGALLNALLGDLLGSSVNLTVADWNALAQTNINLASFLNALQTQTSTGSPSAALGANATVLKAINAAAVAATADGSTAAASALNTLAPQIGALTGNINVGNLLQVGLPNGMLASGAINALDLVTGTIQLFNYNNMLTTPTPVSVSGVSLGQSGTLASVDLYAQVIEPPVIVCGPAGSTFRTAAIRVKLNLHLLSLTLDLGALLGLSGITSISANLAELQLYAEIGRASGTIQSLNAVASTLSIQATPGVADLYLGIIPDSVFFNRSRVLTDLDVDYATAGSVSLTVLGIVTTVDLQLKSFAHGQAPFASTLNFTGPWPQTRTASTSVGFLNNLLTGLVVTNLQVRTFPTIGLSALLVPALKPVVATALNTVLGNLLPNLLDPLLQTLGVKIGEVDVTVTGFLTACGLSGYVYSDANHNSSKDGVEAGCGSALWVKLVSPSTPTVAVDVASVNSTTGAYSFSTVRTGSYTLVVDNNATLSDVTVGLPSGWLATAESTAGVRATTMATSDLANQNIGLFNGSQITGTVFKDNGITSGTPNNSIKDGGEIGLAGVTVKVTDNGGSTIYDTTSSTTNGAYTLWVPSAAGAATLKIVETNLTNYISIGGNVGNTSGSYSRSTDTVSFTHASGNLYSGVNFADVPDNALNGDNSQVILPGSVAFHPHVFTAGTAGQLTLNLNGSATPSGVNWTSILYRDTNCNSVLDSGEAPVSAAISVVADQRLCFIVKTTAPSNAPFDAQYAQTLNGSFTYTNSALTWSGSRNDLTLTGNPTNAGLLLSKVVDKATALPGDTITYTIRYENRSSGSLSNIKVRDSTPSYTVFSSAACGTVPSGISSCSITQQPAAAATGSLEWTLGGSLAPGLFGTVTFSVVVQ